MRSNPMRERFMNNRAVLNGWLHIPSGVSAEAMAHQGFDSLTIDMQHGLIHYESALAMLQAISTTSVPALARVPWNEPGIIMKMLDAGCYGIICPMVNTREEAAAFVEACRYPPAGYRSFGPTRVKYYAGHDYAAHANETVVTLAMIETVEALENLDEILTVPGLDGVYVGPADLSQSFGGDPGADFGSGPVVDALERIVTAANGRGLVAGLHNNSADYARQMIAMGYRFVTVSSDLNFMAQGARTVTTALTERQFSPDSGPY